MERLRNSLLLPFNSIVYHDGHKKTTRKGLKPHSCASWNEYNCIAHNMYRFNGVKNSGAETDNIIIKPTAHDINIELSKSKEGTYSIFDMQGKCLKNGSYKNFQFSIPAHFSAGIYILQVKSNTGNLATKRFSVNP